MDKGLDPESNLEDSGDVEMELDDLIDNKEVRFVLLLTMSFLVFGDLFIGFGLKLMLRWTLFCIYCY